MKKTRMLLFSVVILLSHFLLSISEVSSTKIDKSLISIAEYSPYEVIIKFKKYVPAQIIQKTIESLQGKIITYLGQELTARERVPNNLSHRSFTGDDALFLIRVPDYMGADNAISLLRYNSEVDYVERNYALFSLAINDPLFNNQWALNNDGQSGGTPDADIDAPEAWALSAGSSDIVVAVIDGGIDYSHPDIAPNLWVNPGEWGPDGLGGNKQDNSIDDDHNGYCDDWRGWHFGSDIPEDRRNDPQAQYSDHGTLIAGIIGAAWNDMGIRGINQNVKIMNLNAEASFSLPPVIWAADFIQALDYAAANGASVISCSLGYKPTDTYFIGYSNAMEQAIIRAKNRGILFVSACGNTDRMLPNLDSSPVYPGCFPEDNIINVLTTNEDDQLDSSSCWGNYSVDIGAPGKNIFSAVRTLGRAPEDWYSGGHTGTSYAAPHVAGVAALALGKCPAFTYSVLKSRILNNSDSLFSLFFKCRSRARVNAFKVLYDPTNPSTPVTPTNLIAYPTSWYTIELYWQDNSSNEVGFEIQRSNVDKPVFLRYMSVDQNTHVFEDRYAYTRGPGAGILHSYRVRAGNLGAMSPFSNIASTTIPYALPMAPSDLYSQSPTFVSVPIVLTWTDNADNETNYVIETCQEGIGVWTELATPGANSTQYTIDMGQSGAGTYYYRIRAQNPLGFSSYSNQLTIVVEAY